MSSTNKVHHAHFSKVVGELHGALLDIVSAMNRPQRDEALIREAGVQIDRALFPLLVGIGRFGPVGVVDMADRVGRDYTTVSRQVAKLQELGLVHRRPGARDRRVSEASLTESGRAMTERLDAARRRMAETALAGWQPDELDELARLMRRLADAMGERRPPAADDTAAAQANPSAGSG